jgi:vacuolar-type H+-ATPase subunit I/STV1
VARGAGVVHPVLAEGRAAAVSPTTAAGKAIVARIEEDLASWTAAASEDELDTYTRMARIARRDKLRDLLAWLPREIARAEQDAIEEASNMHAWLDMGAGVPA